VGAPDYEEAPVGFGSLFAGNITLTGGLAPVRAYLGDLLSDVLDGTIQPGQLFDRTVKLDDVPDGYAAMAARENLKVMIRP
jgi:threonine dehydrogenase-like Zn-dependent dehydrogenase